MSQKLSTESIKMLQIVEHEGKSTIYAFIKSHYKFESYRKVYTQLYQLEKRGYLERYVHKDLEYVRVSPKGKAVISSANQDRDGKWRMIIFDIPESQRATRDYLRSKIKQLGFRKWQNSTWITPYVLPQEVEQELKELSRKLFVRLVTIEDINNTDGLKELFD
jgi:DNA-binding transcriptional regulator PaaX